jgi:hypothetical protein
MAVHKAWIISASGTERNFTVESPGEALTPDGRVFEDFPDGKQAIVDPLALDETFNEMIHVVSMCNVSK